MPKTEEHEMISMNEFAKRVGCHVETIRYAVSKGRIIASEAQGRGKTRLIDWDTEASKWDSNRLKDSETYRKNRLSKEGKTKAKKSKSKKDWNKVEKHIGDSTLYDTGQMGIDPSLSRFDDIPDIDGIQAPEGSVAYFQAKKLAIDALRNLNKLKLETAQLISVPDAITLYCDVLSQLADTVQTIPSKLSNVIVAQIRKSVESWRTPPENLESEIFRLLTIQCKEIMENLSKRIKESQTDTKAYIDESIGKK